MLELAPLENDLATIKFAIKDLSGRANQTPEGQKVAKTIALAQKYLLDPDKKSQYDRQWRAMSGGGSGEGSASTVQAEPEVAWDMSVLESLLPDGDPQSPFDLATFVRTAEIRDPSVAENDLAKLITLLGGEVPKGATAVDEPRVLVAESTRTSASATSDVQPSVPKRSSGPALSSAELAKRMKAKRQRSMMINLGGLMLGAGLLLGAGIYAMSSGTKKKELSPDELFAMAQQKNAAASNKGSGLPNPPENTPAQDIPEKPAGSGLPKPGEGVAEMPMTESPTTPAMPNMQPPAMPPANQPMAEPNNPPPTTPPATPPGTTPNTTPPADPKPNPTTTPPAMDPATPTPPPATPAADPKLTADQKRKWKKEMEAVRGLIGTHKYKEADAQLEKLESEAKVAKQREQVGRLKLVSSFASQFHDGLVQGIQSLGAAETIKFGSSSEAAFVEGSANHIAIRVSGRPMRYTLDQVPLMLAFGIADLKLDIESATTKAMKGAFAAVHPASNQMAKTIGKRLLVEAAQAGAVPEDFPQVFDEDYSLKDVD